jgi:hypothetical protein
MANVFQLMMITQVNRKRPKGDLVSYYGFTFPRMVRIFGEYRQSYPEGRLHIYSLTAFVVAMIGLVSFAVCFGIVR